MENPAIKCLAILTKNGLINSRHGLEILCNHLEPSKAEVCFLGAAPSGSPRSRREGRLCSIPVSENRADAEPETKV